MATLCSAGSPNRFPLSAGAETLTSINRPAKALLEASCAKPVAANEIAQTRANMNLVSLRDGIDVVPFKVDSSLHSHTIIDRP